jgi:hypothetical protein
MADGARVTLPARPLTTRAAERWADLGAGPLLAGIVVLAIAVRVVGIGSRLSVDEAYSWYVASGPSAHDFLQRLAASENTPPLFYLLVMLMPGTQPALLRVPAALPGVLLCVALFFALRSRLGDRAALLAALGVAVAPYLITYSNLARGFMLADLALLVAFWALVSLSERETRGKWAVFLVAGSVALWTEYVSVICLAAMLLGALWIGRPRRWTTALAGALTLLTLAPWIGQIIRGQHQVGVTKFEPMSATPSLTGLRDAVVSLALGENGGTSSSAGRWLEFAVMLAAGIAGYVVLRRSWAERDPRARRLTQLLAATAVLTLAGHALAGVVGIDVFTQRYLTILVPLAAGLAAAALASFNDRRLVTLATVLLVGLGLAGVVRRFDGQWQPDLRPVGLAASSMHPRTALTNTPLVLYYMPSLHPVFDRPYNIGPGRAQTCARPCVIIDDTRVPGGTGRRATGAQTMIGPFLLTLER